MRDLYVVDFRLAAGRLPEDDIRTVLLDATPRTATFLTGWREVGVAVDLHNLPGGSNWRLRVMKPDGTVEVDTAGSWGYSGLSRLVYGRFWFESALDTPGTWRVVFDNNGQNLIDAPFRVVSRPAEMVNRPPHRVGVSVESIPAPGGEILVCRVDTSLIDEDPDYDIVSYRYQWRVNRKVVRGLTSAALSDALPRPRGSRGSVSCSVTPVDGGRRGTSSRATAAKSTVGE
jgi:hypothetical protein